MRAHALVYIYIYIFIYLNIKQKSKNRIYCSWRNGKNIDCKSIGPASMCFCGHRFKEHEYLEPKNKKVFICHKYFYCY